jgi:N-acetylglucosaminyldiphosphoundecaprenol N-acetyl-beta-D-mannosaminyltransferase
MTQHGTAARSSDPDPTGAVNVLGVDVAPWTIESLIDAIVSSATRRSRDSGNPLSTVHYANVHVLNVAYRCQRLRDQLTRASTVYCDGSGVRLGAALLGRGLPRRLTGADIIDPFCSRVARAGLRLFLLGGRPGIADRAAGILRARHPGLDIAGTHHGFCDPEASEEIVKQANRSGVDVLLVGMGTPQQELWVARHRASIEAPVVWTVGALLDFVVGVQRRAPRWLTDHHMEWLWRLATDPRRLAGRYVVGNPMFCLRVIRQRLGRRSQGDKA